MTTNAKRRHSGTLTASFESENGFTLLEVILALAILAGAVAVLGELVRNGLRNAERARQLTRAELLCEGIVAQVVAGALPASAVSNSACDDDPRFVYSMNVDQASQPGLITVEVTVVRDLPPEQHPAPFTIRRWMIDPGVEAQDNAIQQSAMSGSSSSSSTSGTTGS